MKKLISLLLALAMLLGCVSFAEDVDYVGVWVLTGMDMMGIQMGPAQLEESEATMDLVLEEDGTMQMTSEGETELGVWVATENGIAITDETDATIEFIYQDEILILEMAEMGGVVLMFTREGAAPAIQDVFMPVAMANVDPLAFEGQWLMTKVLMLGMEVPADAMGVYMAFALTEGAGIVGTNESEDGSVVTGDVTYTVEEIEGVGTALNIYPVVEEGVEEEPMVLFMAEDGDTIFVSEDEVYMIFERVIEEPAAE